MLNIISKNKDRNQLIDDIRLAHSQWKAKEIYFQEVTDPDLVDYAIFELEASKLKYVYLLKKMKKEMNSKEEVKVDSAVLW